MMEFHIDQADTKYNHSLMNFKDRIQLLLDVDGIYASIDTKILQNPHIILVHLLALDNKRNTDIGTLKKERGDIFSECCTESFKVKLLRYVNGLLIEMVKTTLNDTYLGTTTLTALQNEASTCRKCTSIKRLGLW